MNRLPSAALASAIILFWGGFLNAQPLVASLPKSAQTPFRAFFQNQKSTPPTVVAAPDFSKKPLPPAGSPIFAAPIAADFSLENSGAWTALPDGSGRVWRGSIFSEKARGLVLLFDQFDLPEGAELFVSDGSGGQRIGAFSKISCTASGKMTIGPIVGERADLELFEPFSVQNESKMHLFRLDWAFDATPFSAAESSMPPPNFGFGQSLACHKNINCPEAAAWQTEKKAVARVMMVLLEGTGFCSGTLLNQAGTGPKKPYLLTGFHCMDGYTPLWAMWKFDFGYEGTACANPSTEPTAQSIIGCAIRSGKQATDFLLVELNPIPQSFSVHFAGWNRSADSLPSSSVFIHHPVGDIKKWSKDNQPATVYEQSIQWNNSVSTPGYTHLKTVTDVGTFEVGSSGSGLFDQKKHFIGNLHGGNTDAANGCIVQNAYFGRFGIAWDGGLTVNNRLKEWLDPQATGVETLDGFSPPVVPDVSISGKVETYWGVAMPNVLVLLTGAKSDSTRTDAQGKYHFSVPANAIFTIAPLRDSVPTNGLSTFDLVKIQKHILGSEPFTSAFQWLAADLNFSNNVKTSDIVVGRQLILGLETQHVPGLTSWRFVASDYDFPSPNPLAQPLVQSKTVAVGATAVQNIDFKGVKSGDVNESADPN